MSVFWTAPAWTWPLLLALAVGAVVLSTRFYRGTRPQPTGAVRRWLVGLRAAALVLLVLAIAGPVITRLGERDLPAELMILVEDSASMRLESGVAGSMGAPDETGPTRWRRAWNLAARIDSALTSDYPGLILSQYRGNGLEPLVATGAGRAADHAPARHGTDLATLKRQAVEAAAEKSVRALVLISDGQETGPVRPSSGGAAASRGAPTRRAGFPTVVVGVGDPAGPADRIVKDLRYPGTVYRGSEVLVELVVDHRFAEDGDLPPLRVRLVGPEGEVATRDIESPSVTQPLGLTFRPEISGPRLYRLEVSPLDNERYLANNSASLAVDVRRERSDILLLADRPGWDVRFLAQAALREPRLALTRVYRGPDGMVHADSAVVWTEPATTEEWGRWDGVILCGWSGALASLDWERLSRAVEAGLGLFVLASDPGDRLPGAVPRVPSGLHALLPVEVEPALWRFGGRDPLVVGFEPAGRLHALLEGMPELAGDGRGSGWSALPPLRALAPVRPREDGRVLLEVARPAAGPAGRTSDALLVVAPHGQGRVGWYGGRNLWEQVFWNPATERRHADEGADQVARLLARNLLVWTAEGEPERELAFAGHRLSYQEGEAIRLSSTWRDLRGQPVGGRRLSLILRESGPDSLARTGAGGGVERTYPLEEIPGRPGEAQVELPPLPPGAYSVQLRGAGDPPVTSRRQNLVVTRSSLEETQVRQDARRLRQLAGAAGDGYVAGQAEPAFETILEQLRPLDWTPGSAQTRKRIDPLAGWPLLVGCVVLLGCEWFLRRRHGLL